MKKLIFILLIFVIIWLALQFYKVIDNKKMTSQVVPYLNDTQVITVKRRMILV